MVTICTICFNIQTLSISVAHCTQGLLGGTCITSGNDPEVKLHWYKQNLLYSKSNNYGDNDKIDFKILEMLSMYLLPNTN